MAIHWRKASLFGGGVALGLAAGALGVALYNDAGVLDSPDGTRVMGAAPAAAPDLAAAAKAEPLCEAAPILPRAGDRDGQLTLQPKPAAGVAADVGDLLLTGKEAAAAGRNRDAEIAFLNACRAAAPEAASEPLPLADAEYQLARHYANVAAFGAPQSRELFARAERLYSAAYLTYAARLGTGQEKTRFALEGLKTVQQVTGGHGPVVPVAKTSPPAPRPPQPAVPAAAQAAASAAAPPQAAASAALPQAAAPAPKQALVPAPVPAQAAASAAAATRPAQATAKRVPERTAARRQPEREEGQREPERTAAQREPERAPAAREPVRTARPAPERPLPPSEPVVEVPRPIEPAPPAVLAEPRRRAEPRRPAAPDAAEMGGVAAPPAPPREREREPQPGLQPPPAPATASGSANAAPPAEAAVDTQ